MKPASRTYWIVQILGWGFFCFLLFISRRYIGDEGLVMYLQVLELWVLLIAVTHFKRYLLLKYNIINLKLKKLVPISLLLSYLASFFILLFTYLSSSFYTDPAPSKLLDFFVNTWIYTLFFLLWIAVYLSFHLVRKARLEEIEKIQLQASHHEIELKNLREQLNPHFLFNSLNSIKALISIEPSSAKQAITDLSNLMRNSLKMGKKKLVTLEEELTLVKDYLSLEKIRFEERLNYSIVCDAPTTNTIPPFIVQTLVENAIKHGISNQINGGEIIINASITNKQHKIRVKNTGSLTSQVEESIGIGIENTKRRLALQYEKNATFELTESKGYVVATISLFSNN
jgi:sensor histidine kinase YesM